MMILNACVEQKKKVDENICKHCGNKACRHAGELTTKERLGKEKRLSKHEYITHCIGDDTLILKKNKTGLYNLFEAWHSGSRPESDYAPGESMKYEDFQLKVFLLADQIYQREKILSDIPDSYETEWESYQQDSNDT